MKLKDGLVTYTDIWDHPVTRVMISLTVQSASGFSNICLFYLYFEACSYAVGINNKDQYIVDIL